MITTYTYGLSAFANEKVNSDLLVLEIRNSAIVTALDGVGQTGDQCFITFKDELSVGDKEILDGIVSAHTGEETDMNLIVRGAYVRQGFYPDFRGYADYGNIKGIQLDPLYNLAVRGAVTTDEGSYRDDFDTDIVRELTGKVQFVKGSSRITGTGTKFMSELQSYRMVRLKGDTSDDWTEIVDVFSDTEAEIDPPYTGTTAFGDAEYCDWIIYEENGATVTQTSTEVVLSGGTNTGGFASIVRSGDYLPMSFGFHAKILDRLENQTVTFGALGWEGNAFALFEFTGTDDGLVTLRTSNNGIEVEEATVNLPGGRKTSSYNYYQVDISLTKVTFYCEEAQLYTFNVHIPGPYHGMNCVINIENTGTVEKNNAVVADVALLSNYNKVDVRNMTRGEPMPVMVREDNHTIYGTLTTTTTAADQTIVEYQVPESKTCYIVGYFVSSDGDASGIIKVGMNDMSEEPTAPGETDCNLCRVFKMKSDSVIQEEWGSLPRFVGLGGDIIKIAVTPRSDTSTNWRASLDVILR